MPTQGQAKVLEGLCVSGAKPKGVKCGSNRDPLVDPAIPHREFHIRFEVELNLLGPGVALYWYISVRDPNPDPVPHDALEAQAAANALEQPCRPFGSFGVASDCIDPDGAGEGRMERKCSKVK